MEKINPQSTQEFLERIKTLEPSVVAVEGITIRVCKNVFPPKMIDSRVIQDLIAPVDMQGKSVLDVGTGTGIQAILAAKKGAHTVIGIDISEEAIVCARHNTETNGVGESVSLVRSDLFEKVVDKKFDVIIANLPFVDYPATGIAEATLYDPGHVLHRRFFNEARSHLSKDGVIVFPHADLMGPEDFEHLEEMIRSYQYRIVSFIDKRAYGHIWRVYILR